MEADFLTLTDMIDAWPSIAEFAADAGCGYEAARQMRRRASIPPAYWLRIIDAAERRKLDGITLLRMAELAAISRGAVG